MKVAIPINSDVQAEKKSTLSGLDWVGMGQIQSACLVHSLTVPCTLDMGVNLKMGFRGIHMSRLYQVHLDYFLHKKLNSELFELFLTEALLSQQELSTKINVRVGLQLPVRTSSLKSNRFGFRNYPLQIISQKESFDLNKTWIQFEILYSSTCPQSASLSMEMLIALEATPATLPGTPHAQRSRAVVSVQLNYFSESVIEGFIVDVEKALKTPVQTVVKKVDEMEFARLNAENLMFCEDAARIISNELLKNKDILGFKVFCEHQESLHPHNASSIVLNNWQAPQSLTFS